MKASAKRKLNHEASSRRQEIEAYLAEAEAAKEKFKHCRTWEEIAAEYDEDEWMPIEVCNKRFCDNGIRGPIPVDLAKRIDDWIAWDISLGGFDE